MIARHTGALIDDAEFGWCVAVAGYPREGTRDTTGGLYARWVRVPVCTGCDELLDWDSLSLDSDGHAWCWDCGRDLDEVCS